MIKKCISLASKPIIFVAAYMTSLGLKFIGFEEMTRKIFKGCGFYLLRRHYYSPVPDEAEVSEAFWEETSQLKGIDMNEEKALEFLETVFRPYSEEFRKCFPLHKTETTRGFVLFNGSYMAVDAHVYYSLIRHYKPKRIVEIGGGNSTLLAAAAVVINDRETGMLSDLTAVEPFPSSELAEGFVGLSRLIKSKVQDVALELFTSLEAGDILFIDSSHVLRSGGDVQYEYLEILPRLKPGVLVHIHDISLPKNYPRVYYETQLYWNEQYVLQAFLQFNNRFEVLWPGNYMMLKYPQKLCSVFPEFDDMRQMFPMSEPTAFWIRSKD
jgi:hypothetical protein